MVMHDIKNKSIPLLTSPTLATAFLYFTIILGECIRGSLYILKD